MKKAVLFLMTLAAVFLAPAQVKVQDVEDAAIQVNYNFHWVSDTTARATKFYEEITCLRVGPTMAMYFSQKRMAYDSLSHFDPVAFRELGAMMGKARTAAEMPTGLLNEFIYKNFPQGSWTVLGRFDMDDKQYIEEISVPEWELRDSTETILGFPCQMAEANFKGRHWTAFFAPDLPFSEGPWKLSGLPGLILKAFCDNGDYSYDAVLVTTVNLPKVGFYDFKKRGRTKMKRDRYFLEWYRAINDDLSFKIRQAYVVGGVKPGERKKKVQANRDFEETDYPHE